MFIPAVYAVALSLIVLSMICWGSWANTQKLCKGWRVELFYWDYVWGILLMALILGFTLGRTTPSSPDSFIQNLRTADGHHLLLAFLGGIVFNLGNILIVVAIAIAGMAVAFPIGVGVAMVIGSVLNYFITPKGNPLMLFGGIALVCLAILLDALAYRRQAKDQTVSIKGIAISLLGGVVMGLFYPFIAKAIKGESHLGPYTVAFVFAIGVLVSNFPVNYVLMRRPVSGPPVSAGDYFAGPGRGTSGASWAACSGGWARSPTSLHRTPRWWGPRRRTHSARARRWSAPSGVCSFGRNSKAQMQPPSGCWR